MVWGRRTENRFERGLVVTERTLRRPQRRRISVVNRGYDGQKRWNESDGKAYFTGAPTTAALKVSFFGPFYGGYNVIRWPDDDYRYAGQRQPRLSVDLSRTPPFRRR